MGSTPIICPILKGIMNTEKIICSYCKKPVPEQKDCMPTWFGRYIGSYLKMVICKECLKDNEDKWDKGEI